MKNDNHKFRQFFLENLSADEAQEIELRIISDADFTTQMEVAENDLLEDFLENSLSVEEKRLFENNYLVTDERRKNLELVSSLKNFAQKHSPQFASDDASVSFFEKVKMLFAPRKLIFAFGGLALILAVGIAGLLLLRTKDNSSEILTALNNAQKNERPLNSRISEFKYAPKLEGTRGKPSEQSAELDFAELAARNLVRQNPSADNLHELGRVFLARKKFDEAIEQFEKAVQKEANNARLHNDLGVSFLEKGKNQKQGGLELFVKANEEIEKAIRLNNGLLEAYFNRCLILAALNVPRQTQQAWENYLKLDSDSKWADEARENLKKLELDKPVSKTKEEILKEFFTAKEANDAETAWLIISRNREMITGKLIPQQLTFLFAESKVKGDQDGAKKYLEDLTYAADLEEKKSGDLFWRDLAKNYQTASGRSIEIIESHQNLLREGFQLRLEGKLSDAVAKFEQAKSGFERENFIPDSLLCEYWIATLIYQLNEVERSNQKHLQLVQTAESRNYKWLAAQSHVRLSYGVRSKNSYSKSIEFLDKALKYSNETEDLYNLQRTSTSLAFVYRILGRFEKSFAYAEKSLALQQYPESSSRQKWLDYEALTETSLAAGAIRTAILYQKEALALDKIIKDEGYRQTSNVYLGMLYTAARDYDEAESYLKESISLAEKFTDDAKREKALSFGKLKYAALKMKKGAFEEALSLFRETDQFYSNSQFQLDKYESLKGELLCYLEKKDTAKVEAKITQVLELFNQYRERILEEKSRNSFFDNEQDIYDIAVRFEFERANYAKAFEYAEESRSRSLLDLQKSLAEISVNEEHPEVKLSSDYSKPLNLAQIREEMPVDSQLIAYTVLPEKVLIWLITKDKLESAQTTINSETLQQNVLSYIDLITKNTESEKQLESAAEFHKLLLLPVKDKLEKNRQLTIIPDKILFRLPFNTLYSDKYLIEDYKISYAPSANVFLNCTKKAKILMEKSEESLLAVGNPAFNVSAFENVAPLPSAKKEAEEISGFYSGNPTVLTEETADKKNFLSASKTAEVIHFAGHYVVNKESELLSGLVLAGNSRAEASLANYEIIGEKLPKVRLIVLSACETEIEKFYRGEGAVGISRAFLATGVPLVVASQWSVDSEATKELMVRFHQLRKLDKLPTVAALRQAQIEMLQTEKYRQPYYWAAFSTLGGLTEF